MKKFVYFYFNRNTPARVRQVARRHVAYWHGAQLSNYQGGPFADRSGGLISFDAPNLQHATDVIQQDPFVVDDLIEQKWIKEWVPE